ncbi:MAG: hypothetical protein K8953_10550 [Proteobacteria bacterium]|nr:hypothetical protein [Pseudomonadota bacterium]
MRKLEIIALAAFGFIAFGYIISSAYLGLSGDHLGRQATTYGAILGFMEFKNFTSYDLFLLNIKEIHDIPIYQYIIAKAALLTKTDPLVTVRFANLSLWLIAAISGYKFCRHVSTPLAGIIFVFLIATSPLILHYYSVPLQDVMAITFSLVGLFALYKYELRWRGFLYALPFLAIATLIKSPVPFVFVVFYATYIVLSATYKNTSLRAMLVKYAPFIATLMVALFLALLAEQLRTFLLDKEFIGVITQAEWYFGTWKLRTSAEFWQILWGRSNFSGPFAFGYIYLFTITIACFIKPKKNHIVITVSALVAFFAGWLIFSSVYYWHDYYQLPVAIIIFISFAVSLSHILAYITDKIPTTHHQKNLATIGVVMVILLSLFQVMTQDTFAEERRKTSWEDRTRITPFRSIEYALRNQDVFLYVVSPPPYYTAPMHITPTNPTLGGLVSTKYDSVDKATFEDNCVGYIKKYAAILATSYSECLVNNKKDASYFIEDDYVTFYLNTSKVFISKLDIATRAAPVIDATFKVYIEDDQLVYIKESCTEVDIKARFLLHLIAENITDLPEGRQKHGFQNLDFDLTRYGLITNGTCIAVRDLPSYKIKQISTGQYNTATGQRVWEGVINPDSIK